MKAILLSLDGSERETDADPCESIYVACPENVGTASQFADLSFIPQVARHRRYRFVGTELGSLLFVEVPA